MNNGGLGQRTSTEKLIYKLRLMADAGGLLTRDRLRVIIEAADRLDELNDTLAAVNGSQQLMTEMTGGEAHEER